jgi:gamma-glutamyltranspeptidase/glutathione hydrolase
MRSVTKKEAATVAWRPTVAGSHYAASCGHYLATAAAMRALDAGGNAVDAGVTAAIALSVLQPDVVSFAGVLPTLVFMKDEGVVVSLEGLGYWPAGTDIARLKEVGGDAVPEGILRQIVPAAPATHVEALRRFGTISYEQAATPALQLARDGYYLYPILRDSIEMHAADIDRYAENKSIFRPAGKTPAVGSRFIQANLARTIGRMIESERQAAGDRKAKLRAVHDCFYKGSIAADIAAFHKKNGGFLSREDLAGFEVPVASSISTTYRGIEVHACDVWCQGVVLLETLKTLEGIDLAALGHNTPQYLHMLAQALDLSFSDREAYVGDPKFMPVPTAHLLSATYAEVQRARIDPGRAPGRMPLPGTIPGMARPDLASLMPAKAPGKGSAPPAPDTIYSCVADSHGNVWSATPSDTMYDTPMIDGLGINISTRGMQSRFLATHPCSVAPGKRPRLTPSPALALKDGAFHMAWGSPGGDIQVQSMLQVFLNVNAFGLQMQQAIEAPRVGTFNFPNSFSPHAFYPGRLCVENRFPEATVAALEGRGYDIEMWPEKSWSMGAVCAIVRDAETGLLHAGADPRREAYAMAW